MSVALRSIVSRSCRPSGSITRRSVHQIEKFVGSRLSRFSFHQHAQQLAARFARAFSSVAQQNPIKMEHASFVQPIKSSSDTRDYKYLELDNKLAVCLISDPTAEKGAAACDVNVGSFSDPEDVAGLAHFLEHMLFMGSEKYPDENSYEKFLAEHGGTSNAYTASQSTNYYFDVTAVRLLLDSDANPTFAQFFICPLMAADATEREMKAVHSENAKNNQSDAWRILQLLRSNGNPEHPFHKFSTGNLETLDAIPKAKNIDTRAELIKFHDTYYSANLMKLVIVGKEPLDTLEQWARELFSGVKNLDIKPPSWPDKPAYTQAQLGKIYKVVPVKTFRSLKLVWPLTPQQKNYLEKPHNYISHLLGHEGSGSLFALLKNKGWATALVSGVSTSTTDFDLFKVDVDLTEQGFLHKEDVISLTYQYIAMMKKAGPQEWIWNELRLLGDIDFRFMAKKKPMSTATNLASSMQYFPSEDILRGHYIYTKYDPALIQHCMDQLTVDNSFVVYIAKEYAGKTNQVERWYGSHFAVEDIPADVKAAWENADTIDSELHLPEPNLFIPDDFTFFEAENAEQTVPKLVRDGEISKVWFLQDTLYKLPKAVVNLQIYSKDCYSSARNTIITHFCTLLVQDALNEYAYDAQIAGLDYKVEYNSEGIAVTVRGYNQKLGLLTNKIFHKLKHLEIKADRFAVVHEQMRRDYSNFSREAPHAHARYFMMMATIEPRWGWEEKLPILESITQSDLENFLPAILRSVRLQWLIHGNIRTKDALALVDDVEKIIDPCPMRVPFLPVQRAVKFQKGYTYIMHRQEYNDQESNSALYNWYQAGHQDDTKHAAVMDLMQEILSEPCYDVLRTKEQLGYIVWSGLRHSCGSTGWRITIQSSEKDPSFLDERAENFIVSFAEKIISELPDDEFAGFVESLIVKNLEKPQNLNQHAMMLWEEIAEQRYVYDRREREAEALKSITKQEVMDIFKKIVLDKESRKKVSIQVWPHKYSMPTGLKNDEANKIVYIDDFYTFKMNMPLFPLFLQK